MADLQSLATTTSPVGKRANIGHKMRRSAYECSTELDAEAETLKVKVKAWLR